MPEWLGEVRERVEEGYGIGLLQNNLIMRDAAMLIAEVERQCAEVERWKAELKAHLEALEVVDRELGGRICLEGESTTPWVDRAWCAAALALGKIG